MFNHQKIERKWQKIWEKEKIYDAKDFSKKPKFYGLIEFPYPSGKGMHMGHLRSNTAMDIICRKRRMEGYNVLYPIGWDAFGLPTENYAIKTGIHPKLVTKQNTDIFRKQLKSFGFSFDWSREINTTDPKYYKWTQWIFLQLYKRGLAYKKKMPINWCSSCKIGLANEEVVGGACERCGTQAEQKEKEQWILRITKYADRLLEDLKNVDYLERIKVQQANWIGKSEGAVIEFVIQSLNNAESTRKNAEGGLRPSASSLRNSAVVKVFTTRPDTLFGATYLVLSPEHELLKNNELGIKNYEEVKKYIKKSISKPEEERLGLVKAPTPKKGRGPDRNVGEKTGVELKGVKAINPVNKKEIPVFVADYVLGSYGTGAIMAVPAHDQRDWEFAKKFKLPIEQVIAPHFFTNKGKDAVRKDKPTIKRKTVYVFIFDPKNKKYLCLDWEKFGWHSGIIGGVEENENYIQAAEREIKEETGYQNVKFIKYIGGEVHNNFFAAHKDVNRYAFGEGMFFELIGDKKININPEDLKDHKPVWIDADKMGEWLNLLNFKYMWQILETKLDCFIGDGIVINSGKFSDMNSEKAKWEITKFVGGKKETKYHLRDWIFSRQHYWGEPIPLIFCPACKKRAENSKFEIRNSKLPGLTTSESLNPGWVPVPEKDLPVKLPEVKNYKPTDTGESPLAAIKNWVNVKCPKCGGPAKRETDTMPNWAGSSWYFLRYIDPKNDKKLADFKKLKYWAPVDWYNGGMEHTTLHLLYSRFWNKFLYDIGAVPESEPYKKRTSHGMILGEGGEKMSKSRGNVVEPDSLIKQFGADSVRLYEMFMGPFDQAIAWDHNGIAGTTRFISRVFGIGENRNIKRGAKNPKLARLISQTIKKVGEDIEKMNFNTAVASLMIFTNEANGEKEIPLEIWEKFLIILAPFAPHVSEELWSDLKSDSDKGRSKFKSIHSEKWPEYDPKLIKEESFELIIQINGKVRDKISVSAGISKKEAENIAFASKKVKMWLKDDRVKKVIFVPNKLINIVVIN
ncbi:MAG: class I tRNA ligase family protein [Spirochaetota bacterium]